LTNSHTYYWKGGGGYTEQLGDIKSDSDNTCESSLTGNTPNKNDSVDPTLINYNKRKPITEWAFESINWIYNLTNEPTINIEAYHVPSTLYNDGSKR